MIMQQRLLSAISLCLWQLLAMCTPIPWPCPSCGVSVHDVRS